MTRLKHCLGAVAVLSVSPIVSADNSSTPQDPKTDGFTLSKGALSVDASLEMNLSSAAAFKPTSLSPDLWYGVSDDLTVGLVHSGTGRTGFIGVVGDSLCLTGTSNGCRHVYNNVGIDARIRISRPWAVDAGLYVNSISDPFQLAGKLGISGRWVWGKMSLEATPDIFIGFTNREPNSMTGAATNTETLFVPATLSYLAADRIGLAIQMGLVLPFTDTSDTWSVPLSFAAKYAATPKFGLGLAFTFPRLIANNGTADARSITLGGSYAF
ncbi:MAG: hypothetical protein QM831_22180 [Kofleriaceae bacterium]